MSSDRGWTRTRAGVTQTARVARRSSTHCAERCDERIRPTSGTRTTVTNGLSFRRRSRIRTARFVRDSAAHELASPVSSSAVLVELAASAISLEGYAPQRGRHRQRGAHARSAATADRSGTSIPLSSARPRRAPRSSAAGIAPESIDEVLMGHGRQAGSGPNPARQVGSRAGLPDTVPAQTINKACASGHAGDRHRRAVDHARRIRRRRSPAASSR